MDDSSNSDMLLTIHILCACAVEWSLQQAVIGIQASLWELVGVPLSLSKDPDGMFVTIYNWRT